MRVVRVADVRDARETVGEKNFKEFAIRLSDRVGNTPVDQNYYQRIVAKAILFRQTERIVSAQNFGGYRANIVAYSIAYLTHRTAQRLDLDAVWRTQDLSEAVRESIERICVAVHASITDPPGGRNVTEWSKREQCWDRVRELDVTLPSGLETELVRLGRDANDGVAVSRGLAPGEVEVVARVAEVPADLWFALSNWARQTSNLAGWQRSLAFSLGRLASSGKPPSVKQAKQGERILEESKRLGFRAPS